MHFSYLSDERRLDVVEQLIPLAEEAGIKLTHLAMAFAIRHPGVTAVIIGPRTMDQLDDLLAGAEISLTDDSSTGSTRSSHPAPTSHPSTWPTAPHPSWPRYCAVVLQQSAPPLERRTSLELGQPGAEWPWRQ
ncbi:aldo/keto reductase [Gordonia humi]|uniref:NADP-dependent oxidoreductase domain-containing protein n=1 Tax=Gordonia humi TaxID=686429 RepID=A0A840FF30_9ACTN|nr:hypothetical protein [Gordonia humi]